MKKYGKKVVAMTIAAVLCLGALTACGSEDTTEATTEAETTTEEVTTEEETTEEATVADATEDEASADEASATGGELSDNDVTIEVNADTSKGTWYVDATTFTVYFYNVASKDDAYSSSPRIQVSLANQESYDYYADMQENVVDIENKTIGGVDLQGKTYSYVGMEWTEYYGKISGDEYIRIQISDVDIADGTDGANVLDTMTIEVK